MQLLQPVKEAVARASLPIQRTLSEWGTRVANWGRYLEDVQTLQARNEALQALVEQLTIENVELREAAIENAQLRSLLNFKEANPQFTTVASRVIGQEPSPLLHSLLIDRGSEDGIQKGMPVVTARGLVGQVVEIYPHSSRVFLIIDPTSGVSARIQRTRATGLIQGTPQGGLIMRYILPDEEVRVGDIILTAGLGGRFPPGLVIGQVTAVYQSDVQVFQEAELRPTVDFNKLEIILVVTDFQVTEMPEE